MVEHVGFVVVNDLGYVVPCMDGGMTRHHVAVWDSREQAEYFAAKMSRIPGNRDIVYSVLEVKVVGICPN